MKLNGFLKSSTVIAVISAAIGFNTRLHAQTNVLNVDFTGGSITYGNYYVGPYNFLLSSAQSTQAVALVCMNFTNEISAGQTWQANVSTFNNISLTYNPSSLRSYEEMAWLYDYGVANSSQWGEVSYAIWAVNEPGATEADGGWSTGAATLLAEAQAQTFTNGEFSNLAILTPTPISPGGPQEFIGVIPGYSEPGGPSPSPAPEPSGYFGLTTAAVALWAVYKRKRAA